MNVAAHSNSKASGTQHAGRPRGLLLAECCLWAAAIACAAILLSNAFAARVSAHAAATIGNPATAPQDPASLSPSPGPKATSSEAVIGRLEIASIGLTVPVLDNYDPDSLKRGVGHIPGTATPGGLGNLGLAGHRDTFLRPLRNIRLGMEVDVVTAVGRFRYTVDSTEIVTPDQVSVLDIHDRPELTLITCYPFDFIGAAPRRFIVHAHLLSLDPG